MVIAPCSAPSGRPCQGGFREHPRRTAGYGTRRLSAAWL